MTIPTSRTSETGRISIDYQKCTACGICTIVCKDLSITVKNGRLAQNPNPIFGCVGCGQCAAICPNSAIKVEGRTLSHLAIYFYSTPYCDPADPYISATYAMLGAQSLGIGSCMIGSIEPLLKYGGNKIKKRYRIHPRGRSGIMVIFGFPRYNYHHAIKRSLGSIKYY